MARSTRAPKLETRSARLRLPISKKPIFVKIGPGLGLGYRRNQTAGTWIVRVADGKGHNSTKAIGIADDFDEATGGGILDFWQAQASARALRGTDGAASVTVAAALDLYEADLKTRAGDPGNVVRVRAHLTSSLSGKLLAMLTAQDLRTWRDGLVSKMTAASANRTCAALRAALNLAANGDARITTQHAWKTGLAGIRNAVRSRNVILDDATVRRVIAAAAATSPQLGLLVEVAAITGARFSQIARLECQDLQDDRSDPRLMMPASRKGRGKKDVSHRPVPISATLAARLRASAADRPAEAPLLLRATGDRWLGAAFLVAFAAVAKKSGIAGTTPYALRHSSIVRQLLAGVPIRVVAVNHDTSVVMIERTYSRHIGDHADSLVRGALLDLDQQP